MKKRQAALEKKIRELARKHGKTEREVMQVEDSMWKFVKKQINATDNEKEISSNIYLRYLGTIFVAPGRIAKIKEKIKNGTNTNS